LKISLEEAQFYFGILNKKIHKSTKKEDELHRMEQLKHDTLKNTSVLPNLKKPAPPKLLTKKKFEDSYLVKRESKIISARSQRSSE